MTGFGSSLAATLLVVIFALPGASARAQDCTLKQAGSLEITDLPDGTPTVPVRIGDRSFPMLLNLAGPNTVVSGNAVADMEVHPQALPRGSYMVLFGHQILSHGTLTSIQVGARSGTGIPVLFVREPFAPGTGGALGLDLLSTFDVEIDLAAHRVNLFTQDHCPGKVVYWGRPYTVLPFQYDKSGALVLTMTLDGKAVDVTPNLMDATSSMGSADLKDLFGLTVESAGMRADPKSPADALHYRYPFKALSLSGVEIRNPDIDIYPQKRSQQCHGGPMLLPLYCSGGEFLAIGRTELRAVRLYFAFGEKKLYVTAPDPAPAGADAVQPATGN